MPPWLFVRLRLGAYLNFESMSNMGIRYLGGSKEDKAQRIGKREQHPVDTFSMNKDLLMGNRMRVRARARKASHLSISHFVESYQSSRNNGFFGLDHNPFHTWT